MNDLYQRPSTHSILANADTEWILQVIELHGLNESLLLPFVKISVPDLGDTVGAIAKHEIAPPRNVQTGAEEGGERVARIGCRGVGGEQGSSVGRIGRVGSIAIGGTGCGRGR